MPNGIVSEIGYQFQPFLSEIGYGLCTLDLKWVRFLKEATSLSFGYKTISLLMFTPTMCNSLSLAPVTVITFSDFPEHLIIFYQGYKTIKGWW